MRQKTRLEPCEIPANQSMILHGLRARNCGGGSGFAPRGGSHAVEKGEHLSRQPFVKALAVEALRIRGRPMSGAARMNELVTACRQALPCYDPAHATLHSPQILPLPYKTMVGKTLARGTCLAGTSNLHRRNGGPSGLASAAGRLMRSTCRSTASSCRHSCSCGRSTNPTLGSLRPARC
jgi:hypothetical protein